MCLTLASPRVRKLMLVLVLSSNCTNETSKNAPSRIVKDDFVVCFLAALFSNSFFKNSKSCFTILNVHRI